MSVDEKENNFFLFLLAAVVLVVAVLIYQNRTKTAVASVGVTGVESLSDEELLMQLPPVEDYGTGELKQIENQVNGL